MRVRPSRGVRVGLVVVVIVAASACTVRLGTLGGAAGGVGSIPYDINDGDTIVGSAVAPDNHWHPFVRLAGQPMLDLGLPVSLLPPSVPPSNGPTDSGLAAAANNHNVVVGTLTKSEYHVTIYNVAFRWTEAGGVVGLPGMQQASDLNDAGTVVGVTDKRAVVLAPGDVTSTPLPAVPGFKDESTAAAINENGDIAGCATDLGGVSRPVWWDGPTHTPHVVVTDVPTYLCLTDINDNGQAVGGWYQSAGPIENQGPVGSLFDLATGTRSDIVINGSASKINDAGVVVGQQSTLDEIAHAYKWTATTGIVYLPNSGQATAATSGSAMAINAAGHVCGFEREGQARFFAVSY